MTFVQAAHQTVANREAVYLVVVHTMELPCREGIAMRLAQRFSEKDGRAVSAHYCVDPGVVIQCVNERNVAWHCPRANRRGIGIEHAGYAFGGQDHDQTDWASADAGRMLHLSAGLVAGICRRWSIPVKHLTPGELVAGEHGIIGHVDATVAFQTPGGHRDPGPGWPWDEYLALVRAASDQ